MKIAAVVAVVAVFVLGACGGEDSDSDSPAAIQKQVERFYAALASGDGEAACEVLTEEAAKGFGLALKEPATGDCKANLENLSQETAPLRSPRVSRIVISGDSATAHLSVKRPPLESELLLARVDGVWKLAYPPPSVHGSGSRDSTDAGRDRD
jgi:hypothetical protein